MPLYATDTYSPAGLEPVYGDADDAVLLPVSLADGTYLKGTVLGRYTTTGTNEIQTLTITGTPTGGSVTLSFTNPATGVVETTAAIAYNATAATVKTALVALNAFESGDLTVGGGALPGTPITVTFTGRYAGRPVNDLSVTASLTGGTTPAASIAESTPGLYASGTYGPYSDAASDGRQVARLILKYPATVVGGIFQMGDRGPDVSAPAYVGGYFKSEHLVGLDTNGLADLGGRLLTGDLTTGLIFIPS
jgi:hypothetical protein